jgi:hypothetical protein
MSKSALIRAALLAAVVLAPGLRLQAQTLTGETDPIRSTPPVAISTATAVQSWTRDDTEVSELSSRLSALVQFHPRVALSVDVGQATVEHDSLQRITGLSDVQASLMYVIELERSRISAAVNANLPTGKRDLSKWAYDAAFPMGISHYDFHVPFFGRGTSFAPRLAWAFEVSPVVVLGLGAAYHIRGAFDPHRSLPGKYNWGNEFSISGGAEWQASPFVRFSGNLGLTIYDADRIDGNIVYRAGQRIIGDLSARTALGRGDLFVSVRFRSVSTNRILVLDELQPETINSATGLLGAGLRYRVRPTSFLFADLAASFSRYRDTFDIQAVDRSQLILYDQVIEIDKLDVYGLGLYPTLALTPAITIPLRLEYNAGDIDGYEAGAGLTVIF